MIDKKLFDTMWKIHEPSQHYDEYFQYLDWLSSYLKHNNVEKPVVVEIGIRFGQQSWHYIEQLDAEYIGMDIRLKNYSIPNAVIPGYDDKVRLHPEAQFIQGNSILKETKEKLIKLLNGRKIDVLFIDSLHTEEHAKKEWQLYSPLVENIVAFHDINIKGKKNVASLWASMVNQKFPCVEFKGRGVIEVYPEFKSTKGNPKYYLSSPGIGCILMRELRENPKLRHIFIDDFHFQKMKNDVRNYPEYKKAVKK